MAPVVDAEVFELACAFFALVPKDVSMRLNLRFVEMLCDKRSVGFGRALTQAVRLGIIAEAEPFSDLYKRGTVTVVACQPHAGGERVITILDSLGGQSRLELTRNEAYDLEEIGRRRQASEFKQAYEARVAAHAEQFGTSSKLALPSAARTEPLAWVGIKALIVVHALLADGQPHAYDRVGWAKAWKIMADSLGQGIDCLLEKGIIERIPGGVCIQLKRKVAKVRCLSSGKYDDDQLWSNLKPEVGMEYDIGELIARARERHLAGKVVLADRKVIPVPVFNSPVPTHAARNGFGHSPPNSLEASSDAKPTPSTHPGDRDPDAQLGKDEDEEMSNDETLAPGLDPAVWPIEPPPAPADGVVALPLPSTPIVWLAMFNTVLADGQPHPLEPDDVTGLWPIKMETPLVNARFYTNLSKLCDKNAIKRAPNKEFALTAAARRVMFVPHNAGADKEQLVGGCITIKPNVPYELGEITKLIQRAAAEAGGVQASSDKKDDHDAPPPPEQMQGQKGQDDAPAPNPQGDASEDVPGAPEHGSLSGNDASKPVQGDEGAGQDDVPDLKDEGADHGADGNDLSGVTNLEGGDAPPSGSDQTLKPPHNEASLSDESAQRHGAGGSLLDNLPPVTHNGAERELVLAAVHEGSSGPLGGRLNLDLLGHRGKVSGLDQVLPDSTPETWDIEAMLSGQIGKREQEAQELLASVAEKRATIERLTDEASAQEARAKQINDELLPRLRNVLELEAKLK